MVRKYDYLIIGSGVAGMSFALKVAKTGTVALVCKSKMEEANTDLAQGGVATVTNLEVDNFEKHIHGGGEKGCHRGSGTDSGAAGVGRGL